MEEDKIFEHIKIKQNQLMEKYAELENLPSWPADIDNKESQVWIKDFMWRVTEELAGEFWPALTDSSRDHVVEELADALHFYMEIFIFLDYDPKQPPNYYSKRYANEYRANFDTQDLILMCISEMGMAANCLKNKKWKQTPVPTDKQKFKKHLYEGFAFLMFLFINQGLDARGMYDAYFAKHNKNVNRQKSNY